MESIFDKGGAILFIAGVCWLCMGKSQRLAVRGLVSTAIHVVITTVMVGLACRLRWDLSSPEERLALLPGGENNLILWAVVTWAVVFLMVKEVFRLLASMRADRVK